MENNKNNFEEISESFIKFINDIVPSKEELDTIQNKLKNNEKLNFEENLILEKIKILKLMYNIKR